MSNRSPCPPSHPPTLYEGGRSWIVKLLLATSAADTKTQKAKLMYQAIARAFDGTLDENIELLSQNLQKSFKELITYLSSVAQRQFESHVKGSQNPPNLLRILFQLLLVAL